MHTSEKIFILGAGAIGKALAVFLTLKHKDVTLVRTSKEQIPVSEEIVVQMRDQQFLRATVTVTSLDNLEHFNGILLFTNKSFANKSLAERLENKTGESPVVILQNGLGVEDSFLEKNYSTVYRCVLFTTCQLLPSGVVRFKPVAPSPVGLLKGTSSLNDDLLNCLENDHMHFIAHDAIRTVAWKKTIANCVFNSICPLLDIDNGLFHRNEEARAMASQVIQECVNVASHAGIMLNANDVLDTVLMISKSSEGQFISTLQDMRHGRETEIESLNFAIVKIATGLQRGDLVVQTRLLGELIRLKSKLTLTA